MASGTTVLHRLNQAGSPDRAKQIAEATIRSGKVLDAAERDRLADTYTILNLPDAIQRLKSVP